MVKKQEEPGPRDQVQQEVARLHAIGMKAGWFNTTRRVAFIWWEPLPFGPRFLRERFQLEQLSIRDAQVFSLNSKNPKSDDREVVLVSTGRNGGYIAIWNPKPKKNRSLGSEPRFETFSFQRGNSDDFDLVRRALKKWRGAAPEVMSVAEEVKRREQQANKEK